MKASEDPERRSDRHADLHDALFDLFSALGRLAAMEPSTEELTIVSRTAIDGLRRSQGPLVDKFFEATSLILQHEFDADRLNDWLLRSDANGG